MGNHRSFRDEQELLLMPVYAKDRDVLPVAAVYGANASGKSNLLDGLKFMADAVRDSFAQWRPDGGVPRRPFKLDPAAKERPSVFVAEFVEDGVRYTYGFEVDDDRVLSEWLYSYPEKRKRVLFERSSVQLKFGRAVVDALGKMEVLEGFLRPNSLFLSLAAQSNVAALLPAYRWFTGKLNFRLDDDLSGVEEGVSEFLRVREDLKGDLLDLLRAADFGISAVVQESSYMPSAGVLQDIEFEQRHLGAAIVELRERLAASTRDLVELSGDTREAAVRRRSQIQAQIADAENANLDLRRRFRDVLHRQMSAGRVRIRIFHEGGSQPFDLFDESAGTRSWLALIPAVLLVLREGGVLVIDEIDASLHSLLTARLVALFNDPVTNLARGQLIFTTHDATLLHPPLADEVLDRDEVWFVEKDESGASTLYPLSDFKPRRDDNLERRYLAGQYGAVPRVYEEHFVKAVHGDADDET